MPFPEQYGCSQEAPEDVGQTVILEQVGLGHSLKEERRPSDRAVLGRPTAYSVA